MHFNVLELPNETKPFLCLHIQGATQKFPKFLCHSLTSYRNFYSSPSPSKKYPSAVILWSQQNFHNWKHYWNSFRVSIFITSCESVWITSMSSQQNTAWQSGSQWVKLTITSSAQLYYKQFLHSIPTSGTLGLHLVHPILHSAICIKQESPEKNVACNIIHKLIC